MMRYIFSSGQRTLVYLVVSLTLKFFNCQHTCEEIDSLKEGKVVYKNESYAYSQYYHYSQIIHVNQSSPIVDCKFQKFNTPQEFTLKFPFQVYGSGVSRFDVGRYSIRFKNGSKFLGSISSDSDVISSYEYEILNEENLLAVRWSFQISGDSLNGTFKITTLILPNGKIFVYYDNVTGEYEEHRIRSRLTGSLACEGVHRVVDIFVGEIWMKSGTLVEFEVSGDCPKHNTTKTCEGSKTPNRKCMWYEEASMCIVSTDKDIDDFKVNSCQIENSSNVNVSTTSILVEGAGTTPEISESDNGHGKSYNSLRIVIPVVICFLVVCSGCVIGLWLYRKNKCMQWLS